MRTPGVGALDYRAPGVREIAWRLKRPDRAALRVAAEAMVALLPPQAVLVPVPDRWGDPAANLSLCRALAERGGARVAVALTRTGVVESTRERRLRGAGPLPPSGHRLAAIPDALAGLDAATPIVFVDNVVVTGSTFVACRLALGRGRGLAFARDRLGMRG